jgi:hypothetical protein
VNLLPPFAKEDRRWVSRFSLRESRGGVGVAAANGLMVRTGIAAIAPRIDGMGGQLRIRSVVRRADN